MEFLKPDNFTQKSMPLTSELCKLFDQVHFNLASSQMSDCIGKYSQLFDDLFNSLDDEQKTLFEKVNPTVTEISEIDAVEHFNRGFSLGAVITMEIFAKYFNYT